METHKLKILPQYFKAVQDGSKTFEIRKNDRGYKVGDTLILQEYINYSDSAYYNRETPNRYTGREITKEVSYILEGGQYGLEEGYCILGLKDINKNKQEFQLGDTAYFIDEDYRNFKCKVWQVEIDNNGYSYRTDDCDFDSSDIGKWVFTSELYREMHIQNLAESEE